MVFHAVLEINSLRQLQKTRPGLIPDILATTRTILESRGGNRRETDTILYTFTVSRSSEAAAVADALFALSDFLKNRAEDLLGYFLYVDYASEDVSPDVALFAMRNNLRRLEMDDRIHCSDAARDMFQGLASFEGDAAMARLTPEQPELGAAEEFCTRPAVLAELSTLLEDAVFSDQLTGVELTGPAMGARSMIMRQAIAAAHAANDSFFVIPVFGDPSPYRPFLRSINTELMDEVAHHLTRSELEAWKGQKRLLSYLAESPRDSLYPFRVAEEFYSCVELVVSALVRRSTDALGAFFLCVEDSEILPPESVSIVARLCRAFAATGRFVPFVAGAKPLSANAFEPFRLHSYKLPALSSEERAERLSRQGMEASLSLVRAYDLRLLGLYFALQTNDKDPGDKESRGYTAAASFILQQGRAFQRILYTCGLAAGMLTSSELEAFAEELDIPRSQCSQVLQQLVWQGLVRDARTFKVELPGIMSLLQEHRDFAAWDIEYSFAGYLLQLWLRKRPIDSEYLVRILVRMNRLDESLDVYEKMLNDSFNRYDLNSVRTCLFGSLFAGVEWPNAMDAERVEGMVLAGRMRLAILENDREQRELIHPLVEEISSRRKQGSWYGECLLQRARYAYLHLDIKGSLSLCKTAILAFQEQDDSAAVARAQVLLGLVMFAHENLDDARDYFSIASTAAGQAGFRYEEIRCRSLEVLTHYLYGNYSRAIDMGERQASRARDLRMNEWEIFLLFLRARALFDLGAYTEAENALEQILALCRSVEDLEATGVLTAWMARCAAYGGRPALAVGLLETLQHSKENFLFLAEAQYFMGRKPEAIRILTEARAMIDSSPIFTGENFVWTSGFEMVENAMFGMSMGEKVLNQLIRGFYWYLIADDTSRVEGIEEMYRLTREEARAVIDPYQNRYLYWYSEILPEVRDRTYEDRGTILGKAVKHLQMRSARMDEPQHKAAFLANNYWNRRLLETARSLNLV